MAGWGYYNRKLKKPSYIKKELDLVIVDPKKCIKEGLRAANTFCAEHKNPGI